MLFAELGKTSAKLVFGEIEVLVVVNKRASTHNLLCASVKLITRKRAVITLKSEDVEVINRIDGVDKDMQIDIEVQAAYRNAK